VLAVFFVFSPFSPFSFSAMGGYDEAPETMYGHLRDFASSGLINMAGGSVQRTRTKRTFIEHCGSEEQRMQKQADAP
jgi:hypothetical protein